MTPWFVNNDTNGPLQQITTSRPTKSHIVEHFYLLHHVTLPHSAALSPTINNWNAKRIRVWSGDGNYSPTTIVLNDLGQGQIVPSSVRIHNQLSGGKLSATRAQSWVIDTQFGGGKQQKVVRRLRREEPEVHELTPPPPPHHTTNKSPRRRYLTLR